MKSVRFERLLASTAFGLVLALSSYPGLAQQSDKEIGAIPMPDTDLLQPTAKDVQAVPAAADPKSEPKIEPKLEPKLQRAHFRSTRAGTFAHLPGTLPERRNGLAGGKANRVERHFRSCP